MKKGWLWLLIVLIFAGVVGCRNLPDRDLPAGILYTIEAETIIAEQNRIASLTPPTPTFTATATETITPTPTITPTATLEPTPTWVMHSAGEAEVFVLYYHDIANGTDDDPYYQWESPYNVTSFEFEQQVRTLSELGYTSITISDLVKVLYEGGELPPRPVMFTFDSAKRGQYVNAYPILKKYGMSGNLFVYSNLIDAKNSISKEQILEMMDAGWEIGSCGYNGSPDPAHYGQEIGKSKVQLEEMFEMPILAYAYSGGIMDGGGEMVSRVSQSLYKIAFTKIETIKQSKNILYMLGRYEINKGLSYGDFFKKIPWQEGSVSQETMNWALATPTPEGTLPAEPIPPTPDGAAPAEPVPPTPEDSAPVEPVPPAP